MFFHMCLYQSDHHSDLGEEQFQHSKCPFQIHSPSSLPKVAIILSTRVSLVCSQIPYKRSFDAGGLEPQVKKPYLAKSPIIPLNVFLGYEFLGYELVSSEIPAK